MFAPFARDVEHKQSEISVQSWRTEGQNVYIDRDETSGANFWRDMHRVDITCKGQKDVTRSNDLSARNAT